MQLIKYFLVLALIGYLAADYVEVSITDGKPIYCNNTVLNFDDLKVKKINRSDHYLFGTVEVFEDVGNDLTVGICFLIS